MSDLPNLTQPPHSLHLNPPTLALYKVLGRNAMDISQTVTGEWIPAERVLTEQTMEVKLNERYILLLTDDVSLVVSMVVEFWKVGFTGEPQAVKYAGSGKVLACG